jgi:hypothetical protein
MKKMCIGILVMMLSFILGICSNTDVITAEEESYVMKVESKIETSMVFVSFDE